MPEVSTDKDVQALRSLEFCYLCGRQMGRDDRDRDHVLARKAFSVADRGQVPLILPTHSSCNNAWHKHDEELCDLFTGLSDRVVSDKYKSSLSAVSFIHPTKDFEVGGLANFDLDVFVQRWARGFHAALYREPLHEDTKFVISTPLLRKTIKDGEQRWRYPEPAHGEIAWRLYNQRQQGRVDVIRAYNGKCHYICAWDSTDDGRTCCLFALRLHGWENLVDQRIGTRANLVGLYWPPTPRPRNATRTNQIELPKHDDRYVDAFLD